MFAEFREYCLNHCTDYAPGVCQQKLCDKTLEKITGELYVELTSDQIDKLTREFWQNFHKLRGKIIHGGY